MREIYECITQRVANMADVGLPAGPVAVTRYGPVDARKGDQVVRNGHNLVGGGFGSISRCCAIRIRRLLHASRQSADGPKRQS